MRQYDAIRDMSIEEMAEAIVKMANECTDCPGGCIGCSECIQCTESRLRDEVEK